MSLYVQLGHPCQHSEHSDCYFLDAVDYNNADDRDDDDDANHFVNKAHLDGEQAPIFPKWVSWVQQLAEALSGHLDFDCQVFRSPRFWSGDYFLGYMVTKTQVTNN